MVNISEKGAFIEIDEADAFEKGEVVTLTIRGSNQLETFSVTSVIMRVVHAADVDGYGCFFLRLNPQIKRKIARYVLDTLNREEEAVA